ncbi:MAG: hypothetical protein ACR2NS_14805 [Gemmatimonadaceae bacterium]
MEQSPQRLGIGQLLFPPAILSLDVISFRTIAWRLYRPWDAARVAGFGD